MQYEVTEAEILKEGCVDAIEAARIIGCSKRTVYNMMDDSTLPWVRVRSGKKIPLAGIRKYMADNLVQG